MSTLTTWRQTIAEALGRGPRVLPGSLCDETTDGGFDRSRCASCAARISLVDNGPLGLQWVHYESPAVGTEHEAVPIGAAGQPRSDVLPRIPVHEAPDVQAAPEFEVSPIINLNATEDQARLWQRRFFEDPKDDAAPDHAALARKHIATLSAEVMQLQRQLSVATYDLAEITADRDRLDAANGVLVARVRELEASRG